MKNKHILLLLTLASVFACGEVTPSTSRPNTSATTTSTRPFASSVDYDLVETKIEDFTFEETEDGYHITRYNYKAKSTTRVVIPETYLDTPIVGIRDGAFVYASGIKKVYIPKTITNIDNGAFVNCGTIERLEVSEENPNYAAKDGSLYTKNLDTFIFCPEGIMSITIPSSVKHLADRAFYRSAIKEIILQDGLESIGAECFSRTKALTELIMPNTVTSIGESLFSYAAKIKTVKLSTSLSKLPKLTFSLCPVIKEITVPGNIKIVDEQAITDNDYLEKVIFEQGVESIGEWGVIRNTFLKEVVLPTSLKTIAANAFNSNDHLTTITLPEGLTTIGDSAFALCPVLPSINIPSTVSSIGQGVVAYNKKLATIDVEDNNPYFKDDEGVLLSKDGKRLLSYPANRVGYTYSIPNSVERIDKEAITYCVRLGYKEEAENINGTLTIPSSVKKIGVSAFAYSNALTEIYYEGTASEFNGIITSEFVEGEVIDTFTNSSVRTIICSDKTISA